MGMWIFEWAWNHVPWYVPILVIIVIAGFCWQWIAPIWMILPRWLKWTIAFMIAMIGAVQYGRNRGAASERDRQQSLNDRAVKQRSDIDDKIKAMPPNAVSDALRRNGWLRD